MSERKKYVHPSIEPVNPAPESLDAEPPAVEPMVSSVESASAGESGVDSEPAAGNEQRTEAEHDSSVEASDAANGSDEDDKQSANCAKEE